MVNSNLLDLLGDDWNGGSARRVGLGALRSEPNGDEEEKQHNGGSETHAKNNPQAESED